MVHAVAVIAVTDKGVCASLLAAAVNDGTTGSQLIVERLCPFLAAVVVTADAVSAGLVVKIGGQHHRYACRGGTRCTAQVIHLNRLGTIEREFRCSQGGGTCRIVGHVSVLHQIPVEIHDGQLGHINVHRRCGIGGNGSRWALRPFVVVHDLGHRGGYTACYRMPAVDIGQHNVVRIVL